MGQLTPESHQRCYDGVLDTAAALEERGLVDAVSVVRRDGSVVYANELSEGCWTRPPGIRQAMEEERRRPWAPGQAADFLTKARALQDPQRRPEPLAADLQPLLARAVDRARPHLAHPEPAGKGRRACVEACGW